MSKGTVLLLLLLASLTAKAQQSLGAYLCDAVDPFSQLDIEILVDFDSGRIYERQKGNNSWEAAIYHNNGYSDPMSVLCSQTYLLYRPRCEFPVNANPQTGNIAMELTCTAGQLGEIATGYIEVEKGEGILNCKASRSSFTRFDHMPLTSCKIYKNEL
jgi:hypothetical protein